MTDAEVTTEGKAGEWFEVGCAFCRGTGRDPFGLLSHHSDCQNCFGRGEVRLSGPVRTCPFCDSSGVHRRSRLTCIVCGGTGAVTTPEPPLKACPNCHGRGRTVIPSPREQAGRVDYLPCPRCRGKGVVGPGEARAVSRRGKAAGPKKRRKKREIKILKVEKKEDI